MSTSNSTSDLPPNYEARVDKKTGKTYYLNHLTQTTSFTHPRHTLLKEPYTPGLPYPWELKIDPRGRKHYINHLDESTSWLNPVKLEELRENGVLDEEVKEEYGVNGEENWREWMIGEVVEKGFGEEEGLVYWVDYRKGTVDWQSPEDKRIAKKSLLVRNVRLEKEAEKDESS